MLAGALRQWRAVSLGMHEMNPRPRNRPTIAPLPGMLGILCSACALAAAPTDENAFQAMDVFALQWADGPQVSPDGRLIAYERKGYDVMKDRQTSRIWLIGTDGSDHRPLADRPGQAPRFSPDGSRIAFVSPTDEGAELFMHWVADNRTARISQLPESPGNLTWSPDGRQLAFTMFKPTPVEPFASLPKAPEGASWAPPFKVYESVEYRADGEGYLRNGFTHVYIISADGGAPRQITSGNYNHGGGISWSPDGKSLYVAANRRDDWEYEVADSDIYRFDLDDQLIVRLTDRYGPDARPAVSPDGRYLAYLGYDDAYRGYENSQLYLMDLRSGETSSLTGNLDRSVDGVVWQDDSKALYVTFDDRGSGTIAEVSLKGDLTDLADDLGGTSMTRPYSGGSFHEAAGIVAYTRSADARPAELAVIRRGRVTALTDLNANALVGKRLASIEGFRFPSSLDSREIQAWVAKPPGFNSSRKYPLILEIHGGPFAAYGPHFASEIQLYAAAGCVVVYVNPRGSTSYGQEFANLIHHAYPGGDYNDLMSAVDYAIDAGWADPERLYVTGGSGGGILTAWIVTRTNRFAAAASVKPVINWYSFVLTSDGYPFFTRYWFDKKPWEDPDAYLSRSPLHFVDRVTTPTMLMTGEEDHRTPISESEQFYQALKLRKVDAALVRIPGASHGIAVRPSHMIGKTAYVLAWFDRYPSRGERAPDEGVSSAATAPAR